MIVECLPTSISVIVSVAPIAGQLWKDGVIATSFGLRGGPAKMASNRSAMSRQYGLWMEMLRM